MLKNVSYFIFIFMAIISQLEGKESCKDIEYINAILSSFTKEMHQEYGLYYIGYGGRMNDGIKEIQVNFITYKKININEAREIEVKSTEMLLCHINGHLKLRPFLKNYPFNVNNVQISISARTKSDNRPLDGSVAYVFTSRNRIVYRKAELIKSKSIPFRSTDGSPLPSYMTEIREIESEELMPLYEEPYEEALKIVRETPSCMKASR